MDSTHVKTPVWFWGVATLFILWNIFGVMNYLTSVTYGVEDYIAAGQTEEQAVFMTTAPTWYMATFALAIWSGVAGALLFVLRKAWAVKAFTVSLVFILINMAADAFLGSFKMMGMSYLAIMLFVTFVGVIEVFVARRFAAKGLLR